MSFLYPGFLFALSALSIPILIHLFNFRRFKRIAFTNVRFLKEVKEETTNRNRLKHLLILAARLLALFFLVLAFAQPYIPREHSSLRTGTNAVSIYIDNSYSMESLNGEGSLLDEARRKAREIAMAYKLNDRFQLLTNDFEGKYQRMMSRDEFLEALSAIRVSPAVRSLEQVMNRQKAVFYNLGQENKIAYFISDFQENFLPPNSSLQPDSSVFYQLIPLEAPQAANISLDSVYFLSPVHKPGEAEQLVIRVYNDSKETAENIPVKLIINGEQKAIGSLTIQAHAMALDTLNYTLSGDGWQQGEVQITDFPISFDDRYYFSYRVQKEIPVLKIEGEQKEPYIGAAFAADPYFRLSTSPYNQLNYATLGSYKLIVAEGIRNISSGLSLELQKFVKAGGSVFLIPPPDADIASYNNLLQAMNADLLKGIQQTATQVEEINLKAGLFQGGFGKIPENMDLPQVRQYWATTQVSRSNREQLMRLQTGASLLSDYRLGSGHFYLLTASLNTEAGNLAKHALFLPMIYRAAMIAQKDYPLAYTIGRETSLQSDPLTAGQKNELKIRKGDFEAIPDVRIADGESRLFTSDLVKEAGNYELLEKGLRRACYAFNFDRSESRLRYTAAQQLEQLSQKRMNVIDEEKNSLTKTIRDENFGTRLWKICVILALIFLGIEILLLVFWNRFSAPGNS